MPNLPMYPIGQIVNGLTILEHVELDPRSYWVKHDTEECGAEYEITHYSLRRRGNKSRTRTEVQFCKHCQARRDKYSQRERGATYEISHRDYHDVIESASCALMAMFDAKVPAGRLARQNPHLHLTQQGIAMKITPTERQQAMDIAESMLDWYESAMPYDLRLRHALADARRLIDSKQWDTHPAMRTEPLRTAWHCYWAAKGRLQHCRAADAAIYLAAIDTAKAVIRSLQPAVDLKTVQALSRYAPMYFTVMAKGA